MPFFSKGITGQVASGIAGSRPAVTSGSIPVTSGIGSFTQMFGAGQGPIPSTGQLADNPFSNSFNFSIPQPTDGSMSAPASTGSGGVSSYVPLIVVGVIVAGLAWFLFERKR